MKTDLLALPDDCIYLILSCLYPSQIRRLALTFNRRLFTLAAPFLEPLNKRRKDEVHLESIFGKLKVDHTRRFFTIPNWVKCLKRFMPEADLPNNPSHHLEYLNLKGDLQWLEAAPGEADDPIDYDVFDPSERDVVRVTCWSREQEVDDFISSTKELALTLPPAFVKLFKSQELSTKLPTRGFYHLELQPLVRVQLPFTQQEKGYIFDWFMQGPDGVGVISMYLDTAGRHAISLPAWGEPIDTISTESGMKSPSLYKLVDVDFEHWLVNYYFQERLEFGFDGEVPRCVTKHFHAVYTEEGRRLQ